MTGAPIRAFVCSREGLEAPDLMLGWIPMLTEPSPRGPRISRQSGLTLYAHTMRPESKGHGHIAAADARRPPAINFNFLSSPPDAKLGIDDCHRVGPHLAGADRVVGGFRGLLHPVEDFVIGGPIGPRRDFAHLKSSHGGSGHDGTGDADRAHRQLRVGRRR